MGIFSMNIGYARLSTLDQNLNLQIDALSNVGCERIVQEKITGTKLARPQLHEAIEYAQTNNVIVV